MRLSLSPASSCWPKCDALAYLTGQESFLHSLLGEYTISPFRREDISSLAGVFKRQADTAMEGRPRAAAKARKRRSIGECHMCPVTLLLVPCLRLADCDDLSLRWRSLCTGAQALRRPRVSPTLRGSEAICDQAHAGRNAQGYVPLSCTLPRREGAWL